MRASRVQPPTTQIIVKWRDGTASTAASAGVRAQKLGASAGVRLVRKQQIAVETDVLELDRALGANDVRTLLDRMAEDPNVEYAVADERRWPHAVPPIRSSRINGTSRASRSLRLAPSKHGT